MRIIPVLDVMNGVVVRAVGGKRENYRPIVSKLTKSTDPVDVLKALIDVTGSDVAYVADLDAIVNGKGPSPAVLRLLDESPVGVWVDFGIRTNADLVRLPAHPRLSPALGTETLADFDVVSRATERFPHVVGSIDLHDGTPLGLGRGKQFFDLSIDFETRGVTDLIVLDLASVGNRGGSALEWCTNLTLFFDGQIRVYPGGGIKNRDDVEQFQNAGAAGVLVASALHDGTLP